MNDNYVMVAGVRWEPVDGDEQKQERSHAILAGFLSQTGNLGYPKREPSLKKLLADVEGTEANYTSMVRLLSAVVERLEA